MPLWRPSFRAFSPPGMGFLFWDTVMKVLAGLPVSLPYPVWWLPIDRTNIFVAITPRSEEGKQHQRQEWCLIRGLGLTLHARVISRASRNGDLSYASARLKSCPPKIGSDLSYTSA